MNSLLFEERLKAVWALDLEPIIFKLTHTEEGKGWSLERADAAVLQYRQFLELNLRYPGRSIVPTKDIDEVWHTHILDTAKYREDCEHIFGRFLDHFPYFGVRGEEDARNLECAFEETKVLFQTHFPVSVTGASAVCGNSCGNSLCDNNACDSNSCQPASELVRPRVDRTRTLTA